METIVNIEADKTKLFKFSESQLKDNLEKLDLILRILAELDLIPGNGKNQTMGETHAEEIINKGLVNFGSNDDDTQSYEEFIANKTWGEYQRLLIIKMAEIVMNIPYKYGRKCIETEFSRSRHITNLGFVNLAKELKSNSSVLSDALIKEIRADFPAIVNNWYVNQLKQVYISSDDKERSHYQELYKEIYALEFEVARIESRKYTKEQKDEKQKELDKDLAITKSELAKLEKQVKLLKNDIDLSRLYEKNRILTREEINKLKVGEEREYAEFRLKNEESTLEEKEEYLKNLKANKSTDRKTIKFYEDDIKASKAVLRSSVMTAVEIREIEKNIADKERLIKQNEESINQNKLKIDAVDYFKKLSSGDRNESYLKDKVKEMEIQIETKEKILKGLKEKPDKSGEDNIKINEIEPHLKKLKYIKEIIIKALSENFLSSDIKDLINESDALKISNSQLTAETSNIQKELSELRKKDLYLAKYRCSLVQMTLGDKEQELGKLDEHFKKIQNKAEQLDKLKQVAYLKDKEGLIKNQKALSDEKLNLTPIVEKQEQEIEIIKQQIGKKETELDNMKKALLDQQYSRYEELEKKLNSKSATKEETNEFGKLKKLFSENSDYSDLLKARDSLEKQKKACSAEQNKNNGKIKHINKQLEEIDRQLNEIKQDELKYNNLPEMKKELSDKRAFLEGKENKAKKIIHVQCEELIKYQLAYEKNNCIAILNQFKAELNAASDLVSTLIIIANFTGWQSECCSDDIKIRMQKAISLEYFLKLKEIRNTIMHNLDSLAAADEMLNPSLEGKLDTIRNSLKDVIDHMLTQSAYITGGMGEVKIREIEPPFMQAADEFIQQFAAYTINHKNDKPDFTQQAQIFISSIALSKEIIQKLHLEMQSDNINDMAATIAYEPDEDGEIDKLRLKGKIKYDGLLQALGQSLGNLQQYDTLLPDIGKMGLEVGKEFKRLHDLVPLVKEYRSLRTHNNYTNVEVCEKILVLLKDSERLTNALGNLIKAVEEKCNGKQREIFQAEQAKILVTPKDKINQSSCRLI